MKQYKEIRKISASSLRALCIRQNWYTAGDNDEYGHLLHDLANDKENLNTADIIEIAADIMDHSDMSTDYTIESVAFEVASIANVFFEEVLAETPPHSSPVHQNRLTEQRWFAATRWAIEDAIAAAEEQGVTLTEEQAGEWWKRNELRFRDLMVEHGNKVLAGMNFEEGGEQ